MKHKIRYYLIKALTIKVIISHRFEFFLIKNHFWRLKFLLLFIYYFFLINKIN